MPLSHHHHHSATAEPPRFSEDIDSTCSTPFVSAPSSPGHGPSGYFFSAPASPMHFLLSNDQKIKTMSSIDYEPVFLTSDSGSFEFEFSSRFSPAGSGGIGSMTSADELFFNGQIRPMKDIADPFLDLDIEEGTNNVRGRSDLRMRGEKHAHNRKARSMSPLRATNPENEETKDTEESTETTPSCSASSSRSSSYGRNSKKWIFLKDLLHRSKSEGRANNKERFWSAISFSPAKEKQNTASCSSPSPSPALSPSSSRDEKRGKGELKKGRKVSAAGKPANGVWRRKRFPPSAHELHYTTKRAQAEEMKKKTFLPYRQGLLGCLGFSSKSYGAFSGFTRNLNPISSR
ncbi:hypothetical protein ACJIZ3_011594 [Penstemon smallii]|uniref:Uncharacterized protein n=1 Tax=Penstemon smallii TaxID=265156 RepID=A0ABD3UN29_9LAMI